jgi:hypothetical protein
MLPVGCSAGHRLVTKPRLEPQHRCGHDGQRKRVAHMPTAAITTEDSRSKFAENYPHDFTMKQKIQ